MADGRGKGNGQQARLARCVVCHSPPGTWVSVPSESTTPECQVSLVKCQHLTSFFVSTIVHPPSHNLLIAHNCTFWIHFHFWTVFLKKYILNILKKFLTTLFKILSNLYWIFLNIAHYDNFEGHLKEFIICSY